MPDGNTSRRGFLRRSGMTTAATTLASPTTETPTDDTIASKYQLEEVWRDRMTAPDEGKRLGWFSDTRRCFGCHACEVIRQAESDLPAPAHPAVRDGECEKHCWQARSGTRRAVTSKHRISQAACVRPQVELVGV